MQSCWKAPNRYGWISRRVNACLLSIVLVTCVTTLRIFANRLYKLVRWKCWYNQREGKLNWHVIAYGPLTRYVKLWVAHAPGMPGRFSPPPRLSDPDVHHGTCVTHVPWCMPGSLTSGFLWSRWREKCYRHSWRMRNPQFYVSGKSHAIHVTYVQGSPALLPA